MQKNHFLLLKKWEKYRKCPPLNFNRQLTSRRWRPVWKVDRLICKGRIKGNQNIAFFDIFIFYSIFKTFSNNNCTKLQTRQISCIFKSIQFIRKPILIRKCLSLVRTKSSSTHIQVTQWIDELEHWTSFLCSLMCQNCTKCYCKCETSVRNSA